MAPLHKASSKFGGQHKALPTCGQASSGRMFSMLKGVVAHGWQQPPGYLLFGDLQ